MTKEVRKIQKIMVNIVVCMWKAIKPILKISIALLILSSCEKRSVFEVVEFNCLTNKEFNQKDSIVTQLKTSPTFGDKFKRTDGLKIIMKNGDWVLLRLSGTEPLARIYAESDNRDAALALVNLAKRFLWGQL